MREAWYRDIFERVLSMTDDGFIVVDRSGVIIDINEKYCDFLGDSRENIIGDNIINIIPNTKMLDVMNEKYCDEGAIHHYVGENTKEKSVIVSRSYVEDSKGDVISGVAQVKFRVQSLDVAKKLMSEYMELEYYKEQYKDKCSFDKLIGENERFIELTKTGIKAAKTNFSVLLTGDTGTGKEVFARAIHNSSQRADKPMVSINCAAIPDELLESELFGYEEGAFTGAKRGGKKGKFLVANNGTIFLDEIGDMPLNMQAKLLRVLQEREIEPVGGIKTLKIDVRVISATRKNLSKMVEEGEFREDLFYRLNVINIHMIPLKDRKDDILLLAKSILNNLNIEYKTFKVLSDEVKSCFVNYTWPGNVRELDNVIKSAYAVNDDMVIKMCDLPSKMDNISRVEQCNVEKQYSMHEMVENYEKSLILDVLRKYDWKCSKAAAVMGIHKSLLYKKIRKYEIELKGNV